MANKINNIPQHKTVVNTPTTPDLGFGRIYIKSDNQWYGLDDVGVETQLGGGSGSGINLTSLSANAPITYNNTNGTFSINQSNGSTNGYLSSTDWAMFNSKIGVTAGTNNYIAKFTPNGTTIGNSLIQDDGTNLSVNTTIDVLYKFKSQTSGNDYALGGYNTKVGGVGVVGYSNGAGAQTGVAGIANNANATINTGISGSAVGGAIAIGIKAIVTGASSVKYAAQLSDGTEEAGKFLKSIDNFGKANWANITAADVSGVQGTLTLTTTGSSGAATLNGNTLNIPQYSGGSGGGVAGAGTLNYLPKWTPNGTTLGNSQIQDNGSVLWIETFSSNVKFNVNNSSPSITIGGGFSSSIPGGGVGLSVDGGSSDGLGSPTGIMSRGGSGQNNTGIDAGAFGPGSTNIGADLSAYGATENIGAYISAYGDTGTKIGAQIIAHGAGTLYAAQLQDGTETVAGRFLKNIVDGKANWANITAADVSGVQGALTLTTTGSSGAATLNGNTLNIPQYSGGGGGVSGSGTLNYLTKWTPNGTTLGKSDIIENSTYQIGIGESPYTSAKVNIRAFNEYEGISIRTTAATGSRAIGAFANGQNSTGDNYGIFAQANGSTGSNVGVSGQGEGTASSAVGIGGEFQGSAGTQSNPSPPGTIAIGISAYAIAYGGSAYFAKFNKNGVSPLDKVVLSNNTQGYADWGKVTSSYTTGATGTFTSANGKTITVTNGLITSIV